MTQLSGNTTISQAPPPPAGAGLAQGGAVNKKKDLCQPVHSLSFVLSNQILHIPQLLFPGGTIVPRTMVAFVCSRCGKCCASLGPHIRVDRQLSDRDYYCRCAIDNTVFLAHVDPEYCDDIADSFAGESPERDKLPCLFLRKNPEGDGTACAIYATRPRVCRDFRCYRMLICNREGVVLGKVIGKNTLRTADPALEKLWNEQIDPIPYGNTTVWTEKVAGILAEHDYHAEIAE